MKSNCKISNGWCKGCGLSEANTKICFFDRKKKEVEKRDIPATTAGYYKPRRHNKRKFKKKTTARYFVSNFPELVFAHRQIPGHFIKCHYCNKVVSLLKITKDHVVPISAGGANTKENIIPACKECNGAKANIPYEQFLKKGSPKAPSHEKDKPLS